MAIFVAKRPGQRATLVAASVLAVVVAVAVLWSTLGGDAIVHTRKAKWLVLLKEATGINVFPFVFALGAGMLTWFGGVLLFGKFLIPPLKGDALRTYNDQVAAHYLTEYATTARAYGEDHTEEEATRRLRSYLKTCGYDFEIRHVDDRVVVEGRTKPTGNLRQTEASTEFAALKAFELHSWAA